MRERLNRAARAGGPRVVEPRRFRRRRGRVPPGLPLDVPRRDPVLRRARRRARPSGVERGRDRDALRHGVVARPVRRETGLAHRVGHGGRGDRPRRDHDGARRMKAMDTGGVCAGRLAGSMQTVTDVMPRWTTSVAACGVAAWILGAGATVAAAARRGTWLVATGRGDRASVRLPGHQLHARHLDRRRGPHRLCAAGDPEHEAGAGRRCRISWSGSSKASTAFWKASSVRNWSGGRSGSSRAIFIFILAANWVGLIPGVGSMGWGHQTAEGFQLEEPFFRGANADVNLTLAMALVFFASWIVWGLQEVGPIGIRQGAVRAQRREHGRVEGAADRRVLRGRLPGGRLDPVPARLAELPALRQHLRRRNDAGDDGAGSAASAGWCRFRFTSWNCWSVWCRRWCSCC